MINREEIKKELSYGSMTKIAEAAETTKAMVTNWFKGKSHNQKIEDAAVDLYVKEMQRKNALSEKIASVQPKGN